MRSKPRNQTSVRFRSGAMVKIALLDGNIPWSAAENQMKSAPGRCLYHKEPPPCELSDESPTNIPVICEYTLRSVDICIFCPPPLPRFLPALLSQKQVYRELSFLVILSTTVLSSRTTASEAPLVHGLLQQTVGRQ